MALQNLHRKNPSAIPNVKELAMKAICDKDPGVVSSSLHVFYELVKVCWRRSYSGKDWDRLT